MWRFGLDPSSVSRVACAFMRNCPLSATAVVFFCKKNQNLSPRRDSNARTNTIRACAENLVELGGLFPIETNPNPRKTMCSGKKWPKCHFLTFLGGLGWPWPEEFDGFIII